MPMNTTPRMSPFDVLIHLRRADAVTPAVRIGLSLAERLGAWTSGLHAVGASAPSFASPEAVAMQMHEAEAMVADARSRAAWWREQLDARGLDGEWQVAQGDTVEVLSYAARWNDLVVVERPQLVPDAPTGWGLVSRTVFASSAPVVVVPDSAKHDRAGARIVVAWNRSREAMRAVRGALPLLRAAERVLVLEGDPIENPFGLRHLPNADIRAWLARHGVDAEFRAFAPPAKERGAALLDTARADAADLIVMGAWGHSRITELVLGGTTRHVFQSSDLPLLVAH